MVKMIKTILFDFDGVIVNSFGCIHNIYKIICNKLNKKCPEDIEDFRKIYGDTFLDLFKSLGIKTQEEKEKAEIIYKEEVLKQKPEVFKGIIETIKKLHKKYQLILISSNYKETIIKELKKYKILSYFSHVIGKIDNTPTNLNKTGEIIKIVKKLNLKEEQVVMIGDRDVDYKEGKAAGLKNILLVDYGWGYNSKNIPKHKQEIIIKKPEEILRAIEKL